MSLAILTNSAEQGVASAARLLSEEHPEPFAPVPFVWSDQYDVKIQVAGHVRGDDVVQIVEGVPEDLRFVAAVGRRGRLVGAVAFSRPRPLMKLRRMIAERASLDEAVALARQDA